MSRRRLTVRTRLALGYAAVLLVSGAVLLGGAYLIVEHASRGYDRAVAEQVEHRLAELRARTIPGPLPRGIPVPGERSAERRATAAAQRAATPAYRREIVVHFLVLLAAVLVASLAVGRVLATRALRPVRDITRTAQGIGEDDLDRRIAADGPADELTELANTLDDMLERIEAGVDAQRAFAAHASHELRTPLSVIGAEVEACLGRADTPLEQWQRSARTIRRNVGRSERLIGQLLLLARARTTPAVVHPVDLAETAQALLDELERDVHCRLAPSRTIGDPALLEAAVANLLDNAVRYNRAGGAIELRTWVDDGHACLRVGNDGPAVDAGDVERLVAPFVRGRRNGDEPGTGLGLAIVHGIVRGHGGTLDAAPRAGGGLDVTLRVPAG
jgi:signal transduction histidine kinase